MHNASLIGVAVALGSSLMIGIQSTFFTLMGRAIGPARASLVLNVAGGVLAGIVVFVAIAIQGREQWNIPRSALISATIAVAMGMLIVMGVAFSFQRMGVAAGAITLVLGQMLISVIIDTLGLAGGDAIPLDMRRIVGLVVMAIAIILLVPRQ